MSGARSRDPEGKHDLPINVIEGKPLRGLNVEIERRWTRWVVL